MYLKELISSKDLKKIMLDGLLQILLILKRRKY